MEAELMEIQHQGSPFFFFSLEGANMEAELTESFHSTLRLHLIYICMYVYIYIYRERERERERERACASHAPK